MGELRRVAGGEVLCDLGSLFFLRVACSAPFNCLSLKDLSVKVWESLLFFLLIRPYFVPQSSLSTGK